MKKILLLFVLLIVSNCSNTKGVYWCGDHACINKKEKEAYFKKTMIVEVKYAEQINNKDNTEYEKILTNVKDKEKNRIISEKNLSKKTKYEIKNQIKEEKKLAKQINQEEKNRIKETKKLAKKLRKEEKKILNNEKKSAKQTKVVSSEPYKIEIKPNKFSELVDYIHKKNVLKKYPDINKIPN